MAHVVSPAISALLRKKSDGKKLWSPQARWQWSMLDIPSQSKLTCCRPCIKFMFHMYRLTLFWLVFFVRFIFSVTNKVFGISTTSTSNVRMGTGALGMLFGVFFHPLMCFFIQILTIQHQPPSPLHRHPTMHWITEGTWMRTDSGRWVFFCSFHFFCY